MNDLRATPCDSSYRKAQRLRAIDLAVHGSVGGQFDGFANAETDRGGVGARLLVAWRRDLLLRAQGSGPPEGPKSETAFIRQLELFRELLWRASVYLRLPHYTGAMSRHYWFVLCVLLAATSVSPQDRNRRRRQNPRDGLTYVYVPPGEFRMGCSPGDSDCDDNEKPPRHVALSKGFWWAGSSSPAGREDVSTGRFLVR